MYKLRRWTLILSSPLLLVSLISGLFILETEHVSFGHKLIGSSIALGFFVWMPLFIYHRWKNRDVKNYMLTKENIEKMRAYTKKKDL